MAQGIYLALDIGGTKLLVASADATGKLLARQQAPTPTPLAAGLEQLHRMIADLSRGATILGIGAAIGGPLDWRTGVVSPLHQPEWRQIPLRQIMEERWQAPFNVDVDTNAAALAEYNHRATKPDRLLYLTISTGMGGGFVVDGQLYRGHGGAHPEVGHQAVAFRCRHPERVACACGAPDCLEALISGRAIERIYGKPAAELAADEWAEVAYNLGQGVRNLAAIYLPEVVVLGGGVALGGGDALIAAAAREMAAGLKLTPKPVLELSRLGYDTALLGALALARLERLT